MAALLTALRAEIQMATSGTHEAIQKLNENMATDRNFVAQWMKEVGDVVKELKEKSARGRVGILGAGGGWVLSSESASVESSL